MTSTGKFVYMAQHFIFLRLNPFGFRFERGDGGLSTLSHSCGLACQKRVLKSFPGPGYLHSNDGVVRQLFPLVKLYICFTISCCYDSIPLPLVLIWTAGCLSTLCHSCGFICQQKVLKTFPGSGHLHTEDGVV